MAGTACISVSYRVSLMTNRTDSDRAQLGPSQALQFDTDFLNAQECRPSFLDLIKYRLKILFLFWFQFEKPSVDFRPVSKFVRIKKDPHPFTAIFFIKGQCKAAEFKDFEPAVANGTGGEELNRVRQTISPDTSNQI